MARECRGCLADLPLADDSPLWPAEHVEQLSKHTKRFTHCMRGPIERELRADPATAMWSFRTSLSGEAYEFLRQVKQDMGRRGYEFIDPQELFSEAIESAAELGR